MVEMKLKVVCSAFACVFAASCDEFPGPAVRNEYQSAVRVSVQYSDGKTASGVWPTCRTVLLGQTSVSRFGMRGTGATVEEISIEIDAKVVKVIDRESIRNLVEQSRNDPSAVWVIDESGVRLSAEQRCAKAQR